MACSLALAVRGDLSLHKDIWSLGVHPVSLWIRSLRSRRELEYSLTLRKLYTIAAQTRRDRPLSVCSCASGSLRQCNQHRRFAPSSPFCRALGMSDYFKVLDFVQRPKANLNPTSKPEMQKKKKNWISKQQFQKISGAAFWQPG
jgi:hypothetical protein